MGGLLIFIPTEGGFVMFGRCPGQRELIPGVPSGTIPESQMRLSWKGPRSSCRPMLGSGVWLHHTWIICRCLEGGGDALTEHSSPPH